MCQDRDSVSVRVRIAARLSHTGEAYWRDMRIDRCIAPIVAALQAANIDMLASCCGHGKTSGRIDLADGRVLTIEMTENEDDKRRRLEHFRTADPEEAP